MAYPNEDLLKTNLQQALSNISEGVNHGNISSSVAQLAREQILEQYRHMARSDLVGTINDLSPQPQYVSQEDYVRNIYKESKDREQMLYRQMRQSQMDRDRQIDLLTHQMREYEMRLSSIVIPNKKKKRPRVVGPFEKGVRWGIPVLICIILALRLFT
jgi:hypothetical protein